MASKHYEKIRDPIPYEDLSLLCKEEKMANLMVVLPHLHEGRTQQARTEYYNRGGHEMFGMVFEKLRSCNIKVLDEGNGEYILGNRTGCKWIMTARELVLRINEALDSLKADDPSKRFKISDIKLEMKKEWQFYPAAVNCAFFPTKKVTKQVDSRDGTNFVGNPAPVSYPDASEMAHLPETIVIDESVGSESSFNMEVVDGEIIDDLLAGKDRNLTMQKYNVDEDYLSGLYAKHLSTLHNEEEYLALEVSGEEFTLQATSDIVNEQGEQVERAEKKIEAEGKKIAKEIEFSMEQAKAADKTVDLLYAKVAAAEKRRDKFEELYEKDKKRQEEFSSVVCGLQKERSSTYCEKIKAVQRKEAAERAMKRKQLQIKHFKKNEMAFLGKRKELDDSLGTTDSKKSLKGMPGYFTGGAEAEQENEKPFEECGAKATTLRSRVEKASSGRPRRTPRKPGQVQRFTYE